MKYDVIIIGSGLGGLLCGNILSREGLHVCVLEKNPVIGGALQSFTRKGISFDTGIHCIGGLDDGQNLNQYFKYFGLMDRLKLKRLDWDQFDVIAFEDAEFPLAQGFDNFVDRLLSYFPDQKQALESYIQSLKEICRSFPLYNLQLPTQHNEDLYRTQSAFDYFNSLSESNITRNAKRVTRVAHSPQPITHSPLPSILAGNNFLYAGNPSKTPLYIPALINHSFISSAWRPVGGSQQIAGILADSIHNHGGEVITRKQVNQIIRSEDHFLILTDDGDVFVASKVISGLHPSQTLKMIDRSFFRKAYSERISKLNNTIGAFTINIVLKENSFPYLDYNAYYHRSHNVWHIPSIGAWPDFYMLYTPAHQETIKFARSMVIMTYMDFGELQKWSDSGTGRRDPNYYAWKEEKTSLLLNLVEKRYPGLRSRIAFMESSTPLTWHDYTGTPGGSMYGIQKDFNDPVTTIIPPKTKIPGLFFTGQNVNMHGVMGVTIGSVMTCGEIIGLNYLLENIRND